MPAFVIGITGGGAHTDFVVMDDSLQVHASFEAGATNYHNVGIETVRNTLEYGISEVLRLAGVNLDQISAIGAGLGGIDRPVDHMLLERAFDSITPGVALTLDNDAVAGLITATGRRFGVITVSRIGSIAYGFDGKGKRARSGGWGYQFDRGSGYAIGLDSLTAIVRAYDGTGPQTALTHQILAHLGLEAAVNLLDWMYVPDRRPDHIAALALITASLAGTDPVATRIISEAADGLAAEAIAVARQLDFEEKPFPLVVLGSLIKQSALVRELFTTSVQMVLPGAVLVQSDRNSAVGAAIMALGEQRRLIGSAELALPPKRRATEQRNRLTMAIPRRPTLDLVTLMNIEDQRVPKFVEMQLEPIAALIDAVAERFAAGGRLLYIGAGTSGRLAVLDAAECPPTFGTTPEQVVAVFAGGSVAQPSTEGAEDDESQGQAEIAALDVGPHDSVIGIAASGSTPFVVGALREAGQRGALTGCIANAVRGPISALAQHAIVVPTGAEVIMGSTRLKAGTAQKLILNMISTGVMVRVGRTYSNLMVDMQMTNTKLRQRAQVIVAEAAGLDEDAAADLLERCNGEMKTAIAASLLSLSPEEARERLAAVKGNLSRCLDTQPL